MTFSGTETHNGYVEMWGGITHGFTNYYSLEPAKTISWTEWMYPYINTEGLHFADKDCAVTFLKKENGNYMINLCPSGDIKGMELKVMSSKSKKTYLKLIYKSASPDKNIKGYNFTAAEDDIELIISKDGKEIVRLKPQPSAVKL